MTAPIFGGIGPHKPGAWLLALDGKTRAGASHRINAGWKQFPLMRRTTQQDGRAGVSHQWKRTAAPYFALPVGSRTIVYSHFADGQNGSIATYLSLAGVLCDDWLLMRLTRVSQDLVILFS